MKLNKYHAHHPVHCIEISYLVYYNKLISFAYRKGVKKMNREFKPVQRGLLNLINKYQDGVRVDGGGSAYL